MKSKKQRLQPKPPKFQDVFGHSIIELAKQDARVVGVNPSDAIGLLVEVHAR